MPLDYFTDREIFEAVTLSIWLREGTKERFTKKNLGGDKVTASEKGGFASKIGFLRKWLRASVTGLNVTGSSGDKNVTKPNGIRSE
ncbi:hypothetical protein [Oribacterium sp. HCP3S3_B9]|uniref:hypothetical protein n=1 Tax=Oribacterium sp. HCP3S3_B9 TaxID=3438946 RepID=UPI003F88DCFF